jgi:hypothetical protein
MYTGFPLSLALQRREEPYGAHPEEAPVAGQASRLTERRVVIIAAEGRGM